MKHLYETFTDEEWKQLKEAKGTINANWHDFLIISIGSYCKLLVGSKLKDDEFLLDLRAQTQKLWDVARTKSP